MLNFTFNPAEQGLRKVFKEYEELALRCIWEAKGKPLNSGLVKECVILNLPERKSVSRASIINFLNRMVEQGVLDFRDATGKGGHQKQYYPLMYEKEYIKQVAITLIKNLSKDFPEETREALKLFG